MAEPSPKRWLTLISALNMNLDSSCLDLPIFTELIARRPRRDTGKPLRQLLNFLTLKEPRSFRPSLRYSGFRYA